MNDILQFLFKLVLFFLLLLFSLLLFVYAGLLKWTVFLIFYVMVGHINDYYTGQQKLEKDLIIIMAPNGITCLSIL